VGAQQLPLLQTSPAGQPPSGAGPVNGLQLELLAPGWQVSQASAGSSAPGVTKAEAM
jgi:hypothetical protein